MNEEAHLSVPVWTKPGLPKGQIVHTPENVYPVNGMDPPSGYSWTFIVRCSECGAAREYKPSEKWQPLCEHAKHYTDDLSSLEDHWILM